MEKSVLCQQNSRERKIKVNEKGKTDVEAERERERKKRKGENSLSERKNYEHAFRVAVIVSRLSPHYLL